MTANLCVHGTARTMPPVTQAVEYSHTLKKFMVRKI